MEKESSVEGLGSGGQGLECCKIQDVCLCIGSAVTGSFALGTSPETPWVLEEFPWFFEDPIVLYWRHWNPQLDRITGKACGGVRCIMSSPGACFKR